MATLPAQTRRFKLLISATLCKNSSDLFLDTKRGTVNQKLVTTTGYLAISRGRSWSEGGEAMLLIAASSSLPCAAKTPTATGWHVSILAPPEIREAGRELPAHQHGAGGGRRPPRPRKLAIGAPPSETSPPRPRPPGPSSRSPTRSGAPAGPTSSDPGTSVDAQSRPPTDEMKAGRSALPPSRIHEIERRQFREAVGLKAQAVQGREVARAESLLDLRAQRGGQALGRW